MNDIDIAKSLFGEPKSNTDALIPGRTRTYSGIAVANSSNGYVQVRPDADVITGEDDGVLVLPTKGVVNEGDIVNVTVVNGAPMVDGSIGWGDELEETVGKVTNYFWHDEDGAHVSTVENDATVGPNVLIDSDSMDIRNGTTTLSSFGATTRIGKEDAPHINVSSTGMEMWFGDEGTTDRHVLFSTDEQGEFTSIVNRDDYARQSGVMFGVTPDFKQTILLRSYGLTYDESYSRNAWTNVAAIGTQGKSELDLTDSSIDLRLVTEHVDDEEELDYQITSNVLSVTPGHVSIGPSAAVPSKYYPPVDFYVGSKETTIDAGSTKLYLGSSDDGSIGTATVDWSGSYGTGTTHLTGQYLIYSGNASGNLTLSYSASNFEMIRVHYVCGNAGYSSLDVYNPNGKNFTCVGTSMANSTTMQMEFAEYVISGTSITKSNGGYFNTDGSYMALASDATARAQIRITRVEGFEHWNTTGLSAGSGGGSSSYEAGTGIDISNNTISVDATQLSYDDLQDKPSIEAHVLIGNNSLDDISVHRLTNSEIDALMTLSDSSD